MSAPVFDDPLEMIPSDSTNTRALLKKALSYACGDGVSTVANVVVFTMLLRFLTPSEFGYLSIGQAVSLWVQPVLYMGANLVAVRLIAAEPQHTSIIARRMMVVRFVAAAIASASTVAIALHSSDRSLTSVLLAYSFLFLLYPAQPDFIAIGLHRARVYAALRWVGSACFLLFVLMLTRIALQAWMVPLAYAAALSMSAAYGLTALWPVLRAAPSGVGASISVRVLFRGAIAVVVAQFLQMGQGSLRCHPPQGVESSCGPIGDYGAMSRLTSTGCLPFLALILFLAPVYVNEFAEGDMKRVRELEWRFRMLLLGAGVVGALAIGTVGPELLQLVSGRPMPTAHHLAPVFALICLAIALHNSYTAILVYGGATHLYLATYAAGFVSTLISAVVLIPWYGSLGAALSELAGCVVILTVSCFLHARFVRQRHRAALGAQKRPQSNSLPLLG